MRNTHYYLVTGCILLVVACSTPRNTPSNTSGSTSQNISSVTANENTSMLIVKSSRFTSRQELESHIEYVLNHWEMPFDRAEHAYNTRPKVVYNSIQAKYRIVAEDNQTIRITGEESVPGIGGVSWRQIRKGPGSGSPGTPAYERMLAFAEAMRPDNIIYSTE